MRLTVVLGVRSEMIKMALEREDIDCSILAYEEECSLDGGGVALEFC